MSYKQFVTEYINQDTEAKVEANEKGNWVKVIDNDKDGAAAQEHIVADAASHLSHRLDVIGIVDVLMQTGSRSSTMTRTASLSTS